MKLDKLAYKQALGALRAGVVFDPVKHPRDMEGQFRETFGELRGAKIKLTNSLNVGDVPVGSRIRTVNDKLFEVTKHGKWTTVYPIDSDGKRTGKHTVLPKDTQVQVEEVPSKTQVLQKPQWTPPTFAIPAIPRHIDVAIKTDGAKTYVFTFPDGTKDTNERPPTHSNDFPNLVRTAIAYKENGKYRVYWTHMFTDSDGVKSKTREFEGLGMEDITVHPMIGATHKYVKREKHDWPKDSVKSVLGDALLVDEPDASDVQRTLKDIEYLPRRIAAELVNQNVKIHIGARTVPDLDDAAHLRKVQPRGYPSGLTWNDSGGCYSPMDRFVISGRLANSGSTSTILHEIGHAVGHTLNVDTDQSLSHHHRRLYPKLGPYYQQDGPGGRAGIQELWAESFAEYLKRDKQYIAAKYDQDYADWMENRVAQLRAESKLTKTRIQQLKTHAYSLGVDRDAWQETVNATAKHQIQTADDWLLALVGEYRVRTGITLDKEQVDTLRVMTKNILDMYHGQP